MMVLKNYFLILKAWNEDSDNNNIMKTISHVLLECTSIIFAIFIQHSGTFLLEYALQYSQRNIGYFLGKYLYFVEYG